jgi:hypothetical protein
MRTSSAVAFLLAAASATAAAAQDYPPFPEHPDGEEASLWFRQQNVGYGPFHYSSMSLFPSLRSGFETNFPESMPSGKFDLRVNETWVQFTSASEFWRIDYEELRTNIAFTWALSDNVRLSLGIESALRTGGALDAFILNFHQAFGLALGQRDHFARNENRIEIQPPGGGPPIVVDENDPQPYEQAAIVTLQHTVSYGDASWPAFCWSLSLRGDLAPGDVRRSGPFDLGASLGLVKEIETVHLYGGGNLAWFGREEFFGLKLRTLVWSTTVAIEWNILDEFSVICQYVLTSGGAERLKDFSLPDHEIVAGFKWEPWRGVLIDVSIVENIINPYNSPDFGLHGGITFRW